ncbi:MAG: hypothetical protein ABSG67_04040 [Thermoguttaceae bacterium]|jgi:hypothetical protein
MTTSITQNNKTDQLLIIVTKNGQALACRVLDFTDPASYRPLFKELSYRCVMARPDLAGTPWTVVLEMEGLNTAAPLVKMEGWSISGDPQLLAVLRVPVEKFFWIGVALARQLGLEHGYAIQVAVTNRGNPVVKQWMQWEDDDFVLEETDSTMLLPAEFSTEPLGPRFSIHRRGTFMRCVFTGKVYRKFTLAAAAEKENEQGWLAQVRVHLYGDGFCDVLIDDLVEAPASQRGRGFLKTPGHQFLKICRSHERVGGYLHLHPRDVEGTPLAPLPSGPDVTLAWNLDASVSSLIVMPIALFGFSPDRAVEDIAVCGFLNGILVPIDLEVLCDDST